MKIEGLSKKNLEVAGRAIDKALPYVAEVLCREESIYKIHTELNIELPEYTERNIELLGAAKRHLESANECICKALSEDESTK